MHTDKKILAIAFLAFLTLAVAQPGPQFEAATVKPAGPGGLNQRLQIDAAHFSVRAIPLSALILQAFDVNQYQVIGAPGWMGKNLYEINASITGPADPARVMEMLRHLLMERFHLRTHTETRQTKVFELSVAKGGLKTETGPGTALFRWHTIPDLVKFLNGNSGAGALGWPVVDHTGLSGTYDLRLVVDIHPDADGRSGTWSVDYQSELPRQFGLRLEAARDDYKFLVIDRVEEPSAE